LDPDPGEWWGGAGWHRHGPRHLVRHLGHGPWRRSPDQRIFGGVAGGLSARLGLDVTLVRVGFVLAAIFGGFGIALYLILWLVMPMAGQPRCIAARAASDRKGILLSLALLPALAATTVVVAAFHTGVLSSLLWPFFLSVAALILIWRNCDPEERAFIRQAVEPVIHLQTSPAHRRRVLVVRFGAGVAVIALGLALLTLSQRAPSVSIVRPVIGAVLVLAGIVVLFGPWWLRLARDVVDERQARIRAEDRADLAARVHDSVLQTLALIQRSAEEPRRVVQLARAQERELRAWLFDGDLPGTAGDGAASLVAGVKLITGEVEGDRKIPVEVVTVGDCPLDDRLRALLAAAREAILNAAKWSGAPTVSLYAEVEAEKVSVFVRDRGRGFDPDRVAEDRRGIAHSIQARMLRVGGRATVRTAPGEGTEVELTVGRGGRR
jgi:signal transduction histidine kinase/phage shock protein PspC (stress-responsive transcriptional regulator)